MSGAGPTSTFVGSDQQGQYSNFRAACQEVLTSRDPTGQMPESVWHFCNRLASQLDLCYT